MFDEVQVVRSVSRSDTRTAGYETCLRNEKSERVCFFFFFFLGKESLGILLTYPHLYQIRS